MLSSDPAQVAASDGRPKFWAVSFCDRKKNERYDYPPGIFETLDDARAFVDKYISWGCPLPGTPPGVLSKEDR
ncbi:MAG: hypothetical protein WB586_04655 [Chthoniobacterales bacterium]